MLLGANLEPNGEMHRGEAIASKAVARNTLCAQVQQERQLRQFGWDGPAQQVVPQREYFEFR